MNFRTIAIAAAFVVTSAAMYTPAHADHYDFAAHHCREYGGVMGPSGCYISSKAQRKRLAYDAAAWDAAHRDDGYGDHHHRYHDDAYRHDFY